MGLKSIWMACFFYLLTFSAVGQPNEKTVKQEMGNKANSSMLHSAVANNSKTALESETAPKIVVAEPRFNFGSVVEDAQVVHEFAISNTGSGPLNIQKVKTG